MITRAFPRSSNTYVDQGSVIVTPRLLSPAAPAFFTELSRKKSHTQAECCARATDGHVGWCYLAFRLLLVSGTRKIRLFPTEVNLD